MGNVMYITYVDLMAYGSDAPEHLTVKCELPHQSLSLKESAAFGWLIGDTVKYCTYKVSMVAGAYLRGLMPYYLRRDLFVAEATPSCRNLLLLLVISKV